MHANATAATARSGGVQVVFIRSPLFSCACSRIRAGSLLCSSRDALLYGTSHLLKRELADASTPQPVSGGGEAASAAGVITTAAATPDRHSTPFPGAALVTGSEATLRRSYANNLQQRVTASAGSGETSKRHLLFFPLLGGARTSPRMKVQTVQSQSANGTPGGRGHSRLARSELFSEARAVFSLTA